MAVWYYSKNGQTIGPLDEPKMVALAREGKIKREDLVWREGMEEWVVAGNAGLFKVATVSPFASSSNHVDPAVAEEQRCAKMIEESRAAIGVAPRKLEVSPYLQITPPAWLQAAPTDWLWEIYRQQGALYSRGTVVWGCLIKASAAAITPGTEDCSASIVYSPHRWFDARLGELSRIAQTLGELRGKQHVDQEMTDFGATLFDDKNRAPRLPVPHAVFGEFPMFHTSIVLVRKHLPFGFVTNAIFPILIEPQTTAAAIVLPSRFWSPVLLASWERGVRASGAKMTPVPAKY